jgi:hypothetical protein
MRPEGLVIDNLEKSRTILLISIQNCVCEKEYMSADIMFQHNTDRDQREPSHSFRYANTIVKYIIVCS